MILPFEQFHEMLNISAPSGYGNMSLIGMRSPWSFDKPGYFRYQPAQPQPAKPFPWLDQLKYQPARQANPFQRQVFPHPKAMNRIDYLR